MAGTCRCQLDLFPLADLTQQPSVVSGVECVQSTLLVRRTQGATGAVKAQQARHGG